MTRQNDGVDDSHVSADRSTDRSTDRLAERPAGGATDRRAVWASRGRPADPDADPLQDHLDQVRPRAGEDGFLEHLGDAHHALMVRAGSTLLVEFDTLANVRARGDLWSAGLARKRGWSTLSVIAHGSSWFRDPALFDAFDAWTDEGLFDAFDQVVFAGGGMGAYGAAAYSVAAPGATVVLIDPIATLDRAVTSWERRFRRSWALSFGPRYGYGPAMADAASRVFVVSDPHDAPGAMHAALYRGDHVVQLRAPFAAPDIWRQMESMNILDRMIAGAAGGTLTPLRFAQLWRARRGDPRHARRLMRNLDGTDKPWLTAVLSGHMLSHDGHPAARRRLKVALAELQARGRSAPDIADTPPVQALLAGE